VQTLESKADAKAEEVEDDGPSDDDDEEEKESEDEITEPMPEPLFRDVVPAGGDVQVEPPAKLDVSLKNRSIMFKWKPGGWSVGTVSKYYKTPIKAQAFNYEIRYAFGRVDQRLQLESYVPHDPLNNLPSGTWCLVKKSTSKRKAPSARKGMRCRSAPSMYTMC